MNVFHVLSDDSCPYPFFLLQVYMTNFDETWYRNFMTKVMNQTLILCKELLAH